MLAYLVSVLAGIATPMQASINSELKNKIGSQYLTTMISFTGSVILLIGILLLTEGGIFLPIGEIAKAPWWIWSGGCCGVAIVVLSMVCLPKLGSAQTVTLMSFGQVVTSLVTDQWGLFKTDVIRMDLWRFVGVLVVLVGVVLVSRENEPREKKSLTAGDLPYIICGLVCGGFCGLQIAINGTLGRIVNNGFATALISMAVGWITITLMVAGLFLIKGRPGVFSEPKDGGRLKWWMLTGGLYSVIIVSSNALAAPVIGAGLVTIMNLGGQMGAGLIIDAIGFLGIPKKNVTMVKLAGMAAMVAGTAVISMM